MNPGFQAAAAMAALASVGGMCKAPPIDYARTSDYQHAPKRPRPTVPVAERTSAMRYARQTPKVGRNDPCSCGSGKKFKRCCGVPQAPVYPRTEFTLPQSLRERLEPVKQQSQFVDAKTGEPTQVKPSAIAAALLRAGTPHEVVWAYLKMGMYITEQTVELHAEPVVAAWRAALQGYAEATEDQRKAVLEAV